MLTICKFDNCGILIFGTYHFFTYLCQRFIEITKRTVKRFLGKIIVIAVNNAKRQASYLGHVTRCIVKTNDV